MSIHRTHQSLLLSSVATPAVPPVLQKLIVTNEILAKALYQKLAGD